jgi:general secretion pathway protein F
MAIYEYKGYDQSGRKVSGTSEGNSQRTVMGNLRQQGIFVSELVNSEKKAGRKLQNLWTRQVSAEELAIATRQLSTLLTAGMTLDAALATTADQIDDPQLKKAFVQARDAVKQGEALHRALAVHKKIFPTIYLSMTEVGENSGTLDLSLASLADLLDKQARLRSRINAALAYPLLMAVTGCGVLLFLVGFVLPKVTRMLLELEQVLPLPTRMLISFSNLLQGYGWLLLLILIVLLLLFRRWAESPAGGLIVDRWRLKLPLAGRLNVLIATSRFSRTLATLLDSGLPLLRALEITGKLLNNRVLRSAIDKAGRQVREGSSLAPPLQKVELFPAMLTQMIAIGENTGELEGMLRQVADNCDQKIELSINRMLALLEPVMILLMGSIVGFIVLAILLPIFQASQSLG